MWDLLSWMIHPEMVMQPFEGNHNSNVAFGGNGFETRTLRCQ